MLILRFFSVEIRLRRGDQIIRAQRERVMTAESEVAADSRAVEESETVFRFAPGIGIKPVAVDAGLFVTGFDRNIARARANAAEERKIFAGNPAQIRADRNLPQENAEFVFVFSPIRNILPIRFRIFFFSVSDADDAVKFGNDVHAVAEQRAVFPRGETETRAVEIDFPVVAAALFVVIIFVIVRFEQIFHRKRVKTFNAERKAPIAARFPLIVVITGARRFSLAFRLFRHGTVFLRRPPRADVEVPLEVRERLRIAFSGSRVVVITGGVGADERSREKRSDRKNFLFFHEINIFYVSVSASNFAKKKRDASKFSAVPVFSRFSRLRGRAKKKLMSLTA